jgi:hypothetical protein
VTGYVEEILARQRPDGSYGPLPSAGENGTYDMWAVLLANKMLALLDRYHGQVNGMFTGDECLAGKNPVQGTELCSVVELMYSLEVLASVFGDPWIGDRLEQVAFNALPATFKPDMWAHQYDQQVNQVQCTVNPDHMWTTNGPESNLYGLEPNYGCCTSNMHQGWPKFCASVRIFCSPWPWKSRQPSPSGSECRSGRRVPWPGSGMARPNLWPQVPSTGWSGSGPGRFQSPSTFPCVQRWSVGTTTLFR